MLYDKELVSRLIFESRNKFRTAFDAIADRIIFIDTQFTILLLNRSAAKMYDREFGEIIGRKCYSIFHNYKSPCSNCAVDKALVSKKPTFSRFMASEPEGDRIHFNYPVKNEKGGIEGILVQKRVLQSWENPQEYIAHEELIASVQELFGGIGHKLNNFLGSISMKIQQIQIAASHGDVRKVESLSENVMDSIDSLSGFTHGLILSTAEKRNEITSNLDSFLSATREYIVSYKRKNARDKRVHE